MNYTNLSFLKRLALLTVISVLAAVPSFGQKNSNFFILSHERDSFGVIEIHKGGYQFISPLIDCYSATPPGLRTIKVLEEKISEYIQQTKISGQASHVSFYYRDLTNGPWLGINEEELFTPASLLKLPFFIACVKYTMQYPDFPLKTITYMQPGDVNPEILTGDYIVPGQTYTIKELMERMIINSDNEAKNIILQIIPNNIINEIFLDLGISTESADIPGEFMSVKEYASFFRVLYNASYLSKEFSEYTLNVLSRTLFNDGIVAGLPSGIPVAHKFGERTLVETNTKQLHDCGIIYLNDHPYILCVMTRGKDFNNLKHVIEGASRIVYNILKPGS